MGKKSIVSAIALLAFGLFLFNNVQAQNGNGSIRVSNENENVESIDSENSMNASGQSAGSSNSGVLAKTASGANLSDEALFFPPEGESYFLKETGHKITASNLLKMNPEVRDRIIGDIERYNVVKGIVYKSDLENLPQSTKDHIFNLPQIFEIK